MDHGLLLRRVSNWRRFWEEFLKELESKFRGELEQQGLGYIVRRFLEWLRARRDSGYSGERRELSVKDLTNLGEFLLEKIVCAPRSLPPSLSLLVDGTTRLTLPSFRVDHIPLPDSLFYPTDAGLILVPKFADGAPRLGPILRCGSGLLRQPKTTPRLPLLLPPPRDPTGDAPPDPPRGPRWEWIAVGAVVVVTLALLARRRRALRLRLEAARRRAAQVAAEQEASRLADEAQRRAEEEDQARSEAEALRLDDDDGTSGTTPFSPDDGTAPGSSTASPPVSTTPAASPTASAPGSPTATPPLL